MAFWNKNTQTELRKAMARLINNSFSLQEEFAGPDDTDEHRIESRSKRLMPVALVTDDGDGISIVVGVTHDISLGGMAVVTQGAIQQTEMVVVVGDPEERFAVHAERVSSRPIGCGCFQAGMRFTKLIPGNEVVPLMQYIAEMERDCESTAGC